MDYKAPHHTDQYAQLVLDWYILPDERKHLDKYYILHWETSYFLSLPSFSSILHSDIQYHLIFHRCTLQDLSAHSHVMLSFRKQKDNKCGYVLVTPKERI